MARKLPYWGNPDSNVPLSPSSPPPAESATSNSHALPALSPSQLPKASSNPHAPLISLLTTFYTLLSDLRYYHPSHISHPPHPSDSIDFEEADEWNFTDPDALALLYHLPYLVFGGDRDLYYETAERSFIRDPNWETARDPTYLGNADLIPRHMINLTAARNSGVNLLYDVRARTITAWNHFDDPVPAEEVDGQHDWAGGLRACVPRGVGDVQNQLVQWVLRYLRLELVPRVWFNNKRTTNTVYSEEDRALRKVFERAGWDASVAEGIEAAAWMTQAAGEDADGSRLVATLEEARIRAKCNFDVDTYTRLHREWMREYDLD
jgi:hypothetical protein